MTADLAIQWVAWASRQSVDEVLRLGLTDEQLVVLGRGLSRNRLLNPPKERPKKTGEFVCACGCGETFTAEYVTKKPKFKNKAHSQRYWRRKMKAGVQND